MSRSHLLSHSSSVWADPLPVPFSSVLVGPASFIKKAKHFRKLFGGGVRQSGALAAAADFALTHNFPELKRTHILTKRLNDALKALGARLLVEAETSTIFYDLSPLNIDHDDLNDRALALPQPIKLGGARIIVHIQTSEQAVDDLLELITTMKREEMEKGWVPQKVEDKMSAHEKNRTAATPLYKKQRVISKAP